MDLRLHVIGILMVIGVLLSILWANYVLKSFLKFLNKKLNKPIYDESKDLLNDWDALGIREYAILQSILIFIPLWIILLLMPILFNDLKYILVFLILNVIVTIPYIIMEMRNDVFVHNIKNKLDNGKYQMIIFTKKGYPINLMGLISFFNMSFCMFFGLLNYVLLGNFRFLILTFICLLIELMFLFIDYVDNFIPLDLKSKFGFVSYTAFLLIISFSLSLRFYSWTSWV